MLPRAYSRAIAMLIGTIVGAGIFGMPYVFARAGVAVGAMHMVVLTAAVLLVHLWFGELTLRTNAHTRLVGYAHRYLGMPGRIIASLSGVLGMWGALVAYIVLAGTFVHQLGGPLLGGTPWVYSVAFAMFGMLAVAVGLRLIESLEFIFTAFIFLAIALIAIVGIQRVDPINFSSMNFRDAFLPYGVVLFSLGGVSAIAEIRDTLRGWERLLPRAIAWGTIIAAALTALFAVIVVGVSGPRTTEDAILGLAPTLGQSIVLLGALLGFSTIATSFLMLGLYTRNVFHYDFRIPRVAALLLGVGVPVGIFLIGRPGFIDIVMLTGALFAGLDGILVALAVLVARRRGDRQPEFRVRLPAVVNYLVAFMFLVGMVVTIRELFG
ncbi:MAG: aromatic amino acid transport family protein [bacterium]|nr:aromatic amino acid transport family protein [bacterium]